jgi:surface protein
MIQIFLLFIGIFILWYFNSNQCVCIDTFSIGGQNTLITDKNIRTAIQLWLTDESSARKEYGDISHWDTSEVTDMSNIFHDASAFNGNISGWDTSSVRNMRDMFSGAPIFNGNISGWDTSSVTDMGYMFYGATSFNGILNCWDVKKVSNPSGFDHMFYWTKIGRSKNDPISTGCWDAIKSGKANCKNGHSNCNNYVCNGTTGNCEKSFNGSFSDKESCEKEGCLTKTQFQNKYCNNDTAPGACENLTEGKKCKIDTLKDRNNKPIPDYTSNNYCVIVSKGIDPNNRVYNCVPKCNPDINDCKRQGHHDFIDSGCTNSDVINNKGLCESGYDERYTGDPNTLCKWSDIGDECQLTNNSCG